jgi:hypothetical protein
VSTHNTRPFSLLPTVLNKVGEQIHIAALIC